MKITDFREVKKSFEMISAFANAIEVANEALSKFQKSENSAGRIFADMSTKEAVKNELFGVRDIGVDISELAEEYREMKKNLLKKFITEQTENLKKIHWKVTVGGNSNENN